jgi:hypothetical protein
MCFYVRSAVEKLLPNVNGRSRLLLQGAEAPKAIISTSERVARWQKALSGSAAEHGSYRSFSHLAQDSVPHVVSV